MWSTIIITKMQQLNELPVFANIIVTIVGLALIVVLILDYLKQTFYRVLR